MLDKRMTAAEVVKEIHDGDTVGVDGWPTSRKPMALIREIAKSSLKDLTIVAYGGPEIDLLLALGKVKKVIAPFVTFEETVRVAPFFRRAKEAGTVEFFECSEVMLLVGLRAAAERLPFYPTRAGLGSDLLRVDPLKVIECPYTGEKVVAMPALNTDVALIHVNRADPSGYGQVFGDPMFSSLFARGAKKVFVSAEEIVSIEDIRRNYQRTHVLSACVTGVIAAPYGAHFTACFPNYGVDREHIQEYAAAAADAQTWRSYLDKYVYVSDQAEYLRRVGGAEALAKLRYGVKPNA